MPSSRVLFPVACVVVLVSGCFGGDPAPPPAAPLPDEVPVEAVEDQAADLSVPTPREVDASVHKAGIDKDLGAIVPTWSFHFDRTAANVVAVRVGVIVADTVLTAKTADKAATMARLEQAKQGIATLKVAPKVEATIDEILTKLRADAMNADELFVALDELSVQVLQHESVPAAHDLLALVKAGIWLEGTWCVTEAIKTHGDAAVADALLRQPDVIAWFQKYADATHLQGASAEQANTLVTSLKTLAWIMAQDRPLQMADVDAIQKAVDAVLTEV